ncbi:cytochrome P450 [Mycena galopus ATCC 62051]|nr:cytochrome P450 [Mycena galopus ATCC 62051]
MPFDGYLAALVLPLILLTVACLSNRRKRTSRLPFPPGPKPKFILRNLHDVPTEFSWLTYTEWRKQYGNVVHVQVFGNHILFVNSLKAVMELLEKRALKYFDRPPIHRKLFNQHFRRDAITAHHPVQLRKNQEFLCALLSAPENFFNHTKTLTAAITMATVYGYDIDPTHDRFADIAEEAFKKLSENVSKLLDEVKSVPFEFRDGIGGSSMLSELLEHNDTNGGCKERERMIKDVTGVTAVALRVFFLAMALHPEVYGRHRLKSTRSLVSVVCPDSNTEAHFYCEAVIREFSRWRPISPLGVAHATNEDDIYFIPKS